MSTSARQRQPGPHRYTVEEYRRMATAGILGEDDRVELIQGEVIDMAPTGSLHAGTVFQLARALAKGVGEDAFVWVQSPVVLADHSEPQPDLALLRPRADLYKRSLPSAVDVLLVVEVAESSLAYDRDVKLPIYAAHGIPEAWLVDLQGGVLTIHRQPVIDGYRTARPRDDLGGVVLPQPPGGVVDLRGLFAPTEPG
jgi:Uma2 family endonuclease